MPPTRRRFPFRLVVALTAMTSLAPGAAGGEAPGAAPSADVVRLFKFHAAAEAEALREAVDRARLDETLRDELRLLVREHLRRVDEHLAAVAAPAGPAAPAPAAPATPLDDALDRAADLARDFNDRRIAAWLDEHPAAYQPVQEQIALAEAFQRAAAHEPDAVVRAARDAGLPPDKEPAFRRFLTDAHERLARAGEADARRLQEAEAQVTATPSPDPRPAPGAPATSARTAPPGVRRDAAPETGRDAPRPPGAPDHPAAPRPPARPLPPEARRLQMLDALAFADAQARLAAAGREVRAEAEKLLPQPTQRKALEDEMLRWYQAHVPAEDGPREDQPDASSPGAPPRPGALRKPRPSNDPGF